MALALSGTSNGSLNNLSLSSNTGTILDSANTTFFGADQWKLSADIAGPISSATDITTNLDRSSYNGFAYIGTGMTESSGIFTFPNTGIWLVFVRMTCRYNSQIDGQTQILTYVTLNNSSYTSICETITGSGTADGVHRENGVGFTIIDVTDVSNVKVKFAVSSVQSTSVIIESSSSATYHGTDFTFMRLGDT
jgi:hypothetical protein